MSETIKAQHQKFFSYLGDVWPHRGLLSYFAIDVVTSFYKNTVLGLPWLFLRPLLPAILFAFMFGGVEDLQTPGMPYMLYILSGMIFLQPATFGLRRVTRSMTSYSSIIKKRYFPRIIIPLSYSFMLLLQLAAGFVVLGIATAAYAYTGTETLNIALDWRLLMVPLSIFLCFGLVLSLGGILTVLNLAANDVRMSLPMFTAGLMLLTPVFYPITLIDESVRWLLVSLNPLAVSVAVFRHAVYGAPLGFDMMYVGISCGVNLIYFMIAVLFFVRADPVLADIA